MIKLNIENLLEILEYYELDYNISELNESEILLENKDEIYELDEFLSENAFSYELDESYDYIVIKFNFKTNADEISSYHDLLTYYYENKLYDELLENSSDYYNCYNRLDEYKNECGMNKLSDISHKFYLNHKNFFSFNLTDIYYDAYELFSELMDESYDELKYEIYESLYDFIDSYENYFSQFRNYKFNITDENAVLIDNKSGMIKNIDSDEYKKILEYTIKSNFYNESGDALYESKLDEFIELVNCFNDYNAYEILDNTESNIKYLHNKCFIEFNSFKKYSNADEYILINYNSSNENESINASDIIDMSDILLNSIIDASEYYEYDSYEFNEFIRIMKILI